MASIVVGSDALTVRLSPWERLAAMHGNVVVARSGVRGIEVFDTAFPRVGGGIRAPGTAIPGLLAYGTYRRRGHKEFLALRRGRRAVRLELEGHKFTAVTVGLPEPEAFVDEAAALAAAAPA